MDFRASHLALKIQEDWDAEVKKMHRQNKENIRRRLILEFGEAAAEEKIKNFLELGNAPFSIIAFHNRFLRQIRTAFVMGSYYPALTSACALGERVLNHLLLSLRDFFKSTPEYKRVYRKSSFDDWSLAINTLEAWGVLLPSAIADYRRLLNIRNRTIHFDPATDQDDRGLALSAVQLLSNIISAQFIAFGIRPWFIEGTPGVSFIKKAAEVEPFVRTVYLPNCVLVGPNHRLEPQFTPAGTNWIVNDDHDYPNQEISDEQFAQVFNAR
jgi:hypothetical protein